MPLDGHLPVVGRLDQLEAGRHAVLSVRRVHLVWSEQSMSYFWAAEQ